MLRFVALSALVYLAAAYQLGAPPEACQSRTPGHGKSKVRNEECPFIFTGVPWSPGEFVDVGVLRQQEQSSESFEGFLASIFYNGEPVGEARIIQEYSSGVKLACDGTSLTHSNKDSKSDVLFQWKAPEDLDPSAELTFRLTVVREFDEYWVDCNPTSYLSAESEPASSSTLPTSTGSTFSGSTATTTPTTAAATEAPTTRARKTRPTTEAPTTQAPTTQAPTTQAPTTQAPTTQAPTTQAPTTQAPTTQAPTTKAAATQAPTTKTAATQAPTTKAPATQSPTTQRVETTEITTRRRQEVTTKATTTQATTTSKKSTGPSVTGQVDGYMSYKGMETLKHETISSSECTEMDNTYKIKPGTDCTEYTQSWAKGRVSKDMKCSRSTRFDPRVCSCAYTMYCPVP